jgi:hypothetical protein
VCTENLNPNVMVVKSAEHWVLSDNPGVILGQL